MVRSHPVASAALPLLPRAGPDESGEHRAVALGTWTVSTRVVDMPCSPGRRVIFAADLDAAGLAPWGKHMPGSRALVTVPSWVLQLRDALVNVQRPPIGFVHWVLSRAGELPRDKREQFAASCDSLVRLDARASKAITELLDMMSDEARGEIGAPCE